MARVRRGGHYCVTVEFTVVLRVHKSRLVFVLVPRLPLQTPVGMFIPVPFGALVADVVQRCQMAFFWVIPTMANNL